MSVRLSVVVCLTYWTRYAGVQSGEVKVTWLMGDVGAFALILYIIDLQVARVLNCPAAGLVTLSAQWLSNWSSDLGYTQLLSSWSSDCDFCAVSWLVSVCNDLIDCWLSSASIYRCFGIHSRSSDLVSFMQSQLLAICLYSCIPYFPSLPPPSLGSFSTASVQCDRARTGASYQLFIESLLLGP